MDPANYAQFLLESYAAGNGTSYIEKSLGSYVTSLLQEADSNGDDCGGSREALVELLQEHCSLSQNLAEEALDQIHRVVSNGLPAIFDTLQQEATGMDPFPTSPLHDVDSLIPGDLLGDLEDHAVPSYRAGVSNQRLDSGLPNLERTEDFPPLHAATISPPAPSTSKKFKSNRGKKAVDSANVKSSDLAAALFRPSRSRQNSVDETARSTSTSPQPDHAQPYASQVYDSLPFDSAVEIVLSMNQDLSEEAAASACRAAHCDVNLAQYLVEQALAAPPVCRHLLGSGCYRADCQFSHDLESHTCMFWMQGRCTKGSSCSFRHGFDESVLQGIYGDAYPSESHQLESSMPMYHQCESYESQLASGGTAAAAPQNTNVTSPWESATTFANVAKGSWTSPGHIATSTQLASQSNNAPTVKIPLDVWTPQEHRDSSVFYVADPMARYLIVQQGSRREDVIDLHFQSIKTFPVVLATVLPEKLVKFSQVWIVTGTGHHVGTRTHQKGGGALESALVQWLQQEGYNFKRGKDRNGQGGAVLVENT